MLLLLFGGEVQQTEEWTERTKETDTWIERTEQEDTWTEAE